MKIFQSRKFANKVKKFTRTEKSTLDKVVKRILKNPYIGNEKTGDIKGIFVYYVPEKILKKRTLDYFETKIKEKCGNNFEVVFVQKDILNKTESGKHRFIISKC